MDDKRRNLRIEMTTEMMGGYSLGNNSIYKGVSKNISKSGMCFWIDKKIDLNAILRIKFAFPDKERALIETSGRVIWQRQEGDDYFTGVEFKDIDASAKMRERAFTNFFKETLLK